MVNTPTAPSGLSDEASSLWFAIHQDYDFLDSVSLLLLQSALESLGEMREAQAEVESLGLLVQGSQGQLRPNPAIGVASRARQKMLTAFKQLGLDLNVQLRHGGPYLRALGG